MTPALHTVAPGEAVGASTPRTETSTRLRASDTAGVVRAAVTAGVVVWALLAIPAARQLAAPDAGERFYREGIGGDGAAIAAVVQQDIRVRSTDMPCLNCHQRSGFGTAEGPVTTPPVIGSMLFAPLTRGSAQMGTVTTTGAGTRPAYTDQSLLRALRNGMDPAGRTLSPTMPRYAINDETGAALTAYLRSLAAEPAAGVTADSVHLATITTPGVSAARRSSMIDVLETYVRHKNANTRNETGRRERGPWDMAPHVGKYRNWVLHEWRLQGAPSTWPAQLADWYRQQAVFAVVGGLGDDDWTPVHQFAARVKLPVVLPQLSLPPAEESGDRFYSLYFSKGLGLEADLLANQLRGAKPAGRVLQVSRCGTAGHTEAMAVRKLNPSIESECVDPATSLTGAEWAKVLSGRFDTVVLWIGPADLPGALPASVARVYVSSTLLGDSAGALSATIAARAFVLHPFVLPGEFDRHVFRALAWLKANALAPADRGVAINALFAASLVNDALSHPRTLESREYFIERLEHLASRSPHRSTYPAISFSSRRRFASAGGYVLKAPPVSGAPFGKVTEWFLPSP